MSIRSWDVKQFHVVDMVALCPRNWEYIFVWAKNLLAVQRHIVGSVAIQPGKMRAHLRCIRKTVQIKTYRCDLGKVRSYRGDVHQLVLVKLMNIVHRGSEELGGVGRPATSGLKLCNLSNDIAHTPSVCGATEDLSKLLTVPCNHGYILLAGLPGLENKLIAVAQSAKPSDASESSIVASWLCAVA